jgi:hypothetical protein
MTGVGVEGPELPTVAGPVSRGGVIQTQPVIAVLGLAWVAVLFVLLMIAPGAQRAVQVIGPVTTFALPVLIMIAVWWQAWPGNGDSRLLGGVLDTVLLAVAAVLLTALGQVLVGKGDLHGLFDQVTAATQGHFTSFPWLVPLAALIFVTMLQLTFVCERAGFSALGRWGGPAALLAAWVVGFVAYKIFANWNPVPSPALHAIGLSDPGGPVYGLNLVAWALCLAVWQAILFVLMRGAPFAGIGDRVLKPIVANVVTLAIGWGTYFLFKDGFDWSVPRIAAVCGSLIAGVFVASMLTEGWFARFGGPAGVIAAAALAAAACYFGLKALGNGIETWTIVPVELWVGIAALNTIAAGIILHCAVWRRWPFAPTSPPPEG